MPQRSLQFRHVFPKAFAPSFSRRSTFEFGGGVLITTTIAHTLNSSNDIASPCDRTSSNRCVCLLSGCQGGSCLWFIRFGCFCSRSQPNVKHAIALFFCCCCDLCLQSRGCPVASHDSAVCLLLVAAASCLLHGCPMLPPSIFPTAVRRFCCRRCTMLRLAAELASYLVCHQVIIQSAYKFSHNFGWF